MRAFTNRRRPGQAGHSELVLSLSGFARQLSCTFMKTKKNPLNSVGSLYGALGRIRTSDRSVRSRVLYPAELRVRVEAHYTHFFRLVISNIKLKTKKNPLKSVGSLYGALGRIRTSDRSVRSRVLYPAELRVRVGANYRLFYRAVKCFSFKFKN